MGRLFAGSMLCALTACGRLNFGVVELPPEDGSTDDAIGDATGDAMSIAPPSGAVAVFHFDEATGTSTASADAALVGALSDTGWTTGIRGSAIQLGPTGFVDLPAAAALQITGALTLSVWYRLDRQLAAGECVPLLIHGSAGNGGATANDIYALNLISPRLVLYSERANQQPNSTSTAPIDAAFTPDVWHHAIAKRDGTTIVKFQFDGGPELDAINPVAGVNGGNAGHLRIGADVETSFCGSFPGAIDELYIYPRMLDAGESRTLFDAR